MPIMAKIAGVTVSGASQQLLAQNLDGARVEAVFVKNTGAQQLDNLTVFVLPEAGGAKVQVAAPANVLAGASAKVDVQRPVQRLEVEGTKNAGGNTTADVTVVSGTDAL
jgi:hypothetical protein